MSGSDADEAQALIAMSLFNIYRGYHILMNENTVRLIHYIHYGIETPYNW